MIKVGLIQINVSDMDEAVDFYCKKLGFAIESNKAYPQVVVLKNETIPLILYKAETPAAIEYPRQAQTLINFETSSLSTAMVELKSKGVHFLHEGPQQAPVGIYAAFRDPFGNVHELVEFSRKP